jgi:LL-diaminopimelate aminotransferase
MTKRNAQLSRLKSGYLFPEINRRKRAFLASNPQAELISLGVGDTTEPISSPVISSLVEISQNLGTADGYVGYGPEQGIEPLRGWVARAVYKDLVASDEIFISDGAKCDIGRLQLLFGGDVSIAIQDPSYPVYVDGSIIQGVTQIHTMPCSPENGFFPDLEKVPRVDLIYFCSPNNPTGAVATRAQLEELVLLARRNRSIILFDSAYAAYIRDPSLPRTIYEIEGADEVAIEIGSFSKLAGFTGIRLGWTVVPEKLRYEDGSSVRADWNRITTTLFNGASIIAQHGGIAVLKGDENPTIDFYLENARLMKSALEGMGYQVFGGTNAPYLWVRFPGRDSWELFQELLEKAHIIATPGGGYGASGSEFMRFSAYGKRDAILQAIERLLISFPNSARS